MYQLAKVSLNIMCCTITETYIHVHVALKIISLFNKPCYLIIKCICVIDNLVFYENLL